MIIANIDPTQNCLNPPPRCIVRALCLPLKAIMSRIVKEIEIEGKKALALFDTGAFYSYVRNSLLPSNPVKKRVKKPFSVGLGARKIVVRELCLVGGQIEGLPFEMTAVPVRDIRKV